MVQIYKKMYSVGKLHIGDGCPNWLAYRKITFQVIGYVLHAESR